MRKEGSEEGREEWRDEGRERRIRGVRARTRERKGAMHRIRVTYIGAGK